jgi:Spy/CpxP family protein refolding chaperone
MKQHLISALKVTTVCASFLAVTPVFAVDSNSSMDNSTPSVTTTTSSVSTSSPATPSSGPVMPASSSATPHACAAHMKHWLMDKFSDKLHLTSAQVSQMKALRDANQPERDKYRSQMKDTRMQIHQLIQSKDYSEAKAKQLIASKSAIVQKLMLMRMNTAHKMWMMLTPEQQATWQDMMKKH